MADLLNDLGLSAHEDELSYVASEPDLATFSSPGCNTLVTYGYDTPTLSTMSFSADFHGAIVPNQGVPTSHTKEDGDGLVPLRSSLRGMEWSEAQAAGNKKLLYKG